MGFKELMFFCTLIIIFLFIAVINSFVLYQKKMLAKLISLPQINNAYEGELLKGMIDAKEKEQLCFSQNLYNKIVPSLKTIKVMINQVQRHHEESNHIVSEIKEILRKTIKEVRHISVSPCPSVSAKVGLADALQDLVDVLSAASSLTIYLSTHGVSSLSYLQELEICRIVQELTNNILKNTQANSLSIELKQHLNGQLMLMVEDVDGDLDTAAFKDVKKMETTKARNAMFINDLQIRSKRSMGIQVGIEEPINLF